MIGGRTKAYSGTESSKGKLFGRSTIYGVEGEQNVPYMTRIWFGRLRLHVFHRGDNDPDPHDHPWPFVTFPLQSYVEEVTTFDSLLLEPSRQLRLVKAFRFHHRPAEYLHRVIGRWSGKGFETSDKKIVTFVWRVSDVVRPWGFMKNRDGKWCWIGWRDYVYHGGKSAPCE